MNQSFEDLTIAQLKKLYEQFLKQNPNFQTAEELLNELNREKKENE